MRKLFLVTLLVALLPVPPATAQAGDSSEALAHVRAAFQRSSADALRPVLSSDRKTYVSLPKLYANQGYFGSSQTYFIFKEIFAPRSTRGVDLRVTAESAGNIHARMVWRFVVHAEEAERQVAILLMLERTSDGFSLIDIRSAQP